MGSLTLQIPQSGLPNSTEDPKVASDLTTIQTWANGNIDSSNISLGSGYTRLAIRIIGSSAVAVAGDLILTAAGGITVTLPAPALNAVVGILCSGGGAMSGSSPVVVSGTHIWGLGLANVSSFSLGVPGASVVLQSDGTNWFFVTGQQDTGWVALTALSGFTVTGGTGYTGSARLRGDMVELSGAVKNVTGGATGNAAWASLPASIPTPAQLVGVPAITGASAFVPVYIGPGLTPSNAVWVFAAVPNNGYVSLDGLRYRVS